jgi:hypothetical protein
MAFKIQTTDREPFLPSSQKKKKKEEEEEEEEEGSK